MIDLELAVCLQDGLRFVGFSRTQTENAALRKGSADGIVTMLEGWLLWIVDQVTEQRLDAVMVVVDDARFM